MNFRRRNAGNAGDIRRLFAGTFKSRVLLDVVGAAVNSAAAISSDESARSTARMIASLDIS